MTIMRINQVRIKAKEDRGQACLKYMETRTTVVTLKDLAGKLRVTPKAISNSLIPLLNQGLIQRELVRRQSVVSNKPGWAYGYRAINAKKPMKTVNLIVKEETISFHNPFRINP